jgi:hypothetical protein
MRVLLFAVSMAIATDAIAQVDHSAHGAGPASLFPAREASGTAWQPDVTPMTGLHGELGGWSVMAHGTVFAQFLYESGEVHRTSRQAGSINWFMGMARRPAGTGRVGARVMFSLEPWTIGGCGYPDLLATGEVCDGDTIHDLQHPHDLIMELALDYERPLAGGLRLQAYAGLAGEPALGPPAFPHRLSAFPNPIAPISHHWLDATHIAFGVVTAGVSAERWKGEASMFNGREPDEQRTDLDLAALDSFSGRITLAPSDRWALQVSAGHLREAEAALGDHPAEDVDRATASAIYQRPGRDRGFWASTLAYGVNRESEEITHAVMFETSVASPSGRHNGFGRVDVVGKPAHDLHIHEFEDTDEVFTVGKIQFGYLRQFRAIKGWRPGIGAHVNLSIVPAALAPRYDGRIAPGAGVYFNLRP